MVKMTSLVRTFFFFMLILFATELSGVKQLAEARTCESQSHTFHGTCLSNHNCAQVCHNEGFSGGKCNGFRRRCFCTRPC